jgi:hypothetical protein
MLTRQRLVPMSTRTMASQPIKTDGSRTDQDKDPMSTPMNATARLTEKPAPAGCICRPPVRNDVAWHHVTCPWRVARLREQRIARES